MRPGCTLLALVASLMLLLLLRPLWRPPDTPARSRLSVEKSRETTPGTSVTLRTLRSPVTSVPHTRNSTYLQHETTPQVTEKCKTLQHDLKSLSNKTKRYSEDDYIQIITNIKNCPWRRHAEEYENFRAKLASCCDAVQTFVVSQNNTPMGTNMSYEVESKGQIPIRENIFQMFPVSQPFVNYPYNQCAVVGNGGILNKSLCGAEINKADFVFRCNLPPVTGNASKDVGNKTNLVTVNPSIITLRYKSLKGKNTKFLEDISNYGDTFLLLPAFSYRFNTGISFKVYQTLHDSKVKQKVLFFHPSYLRRLALFWRTRGVTAYRLSTGLMIASVAVELCKNVTLYGFWPFSKNIEKAPISHHYYDNKLPKRGFHQMPKEFNQMLQLHMRGILKLQLGKCDVA
ncbi:alpha-2,8-sialyltransferase 8F [Alexandromys fortis]|uniref:alpha-2,8-sialyltransferase 8F n=1 Tax=Alexandromys fortis TaxID=100897 RepID=UPI00215319BD|nr:alpha-2,8-sialyltransferase 8F [Microtus fortis]